MVAQPTDASGSQRFRKRDRVRHSRDYARSRAEGKRVSTRAFALEARASREGSRLGLVMSRRVGGAVVRNRVKRAVREWFRRSRPELGRELELVVIARSEAARLSTREVWLELSALAARAAR